MLQARIAQVFYARCWVGSACGEAHCRQCVIRHINAGSFTTLFQPALALGMLSRRQVYCDALAHERAWNGGRPPFLNQTASRDARAAAAVAECGDYHAGIAHVLRERPTQVRRLTPAYSIWSLLYKC